MKLISFILFRLKITVLNSSKVGISWTISTLLTQNLNLLYIEEISFFKVSVDETSIDIAIIASFSKSFNDFII